jgi:hypothetical protein
MAMEVHGTLGCDMDRFIRECVRLFHYRWSRSHLSSPFCIQFFKQHISIVLQCALTFVVKKKIALTGDVCYRPLTIIKTHNLHASDIRGAISEIVSYHKKD